MSHQHQRHLGVRSKWRLKQQPTPTRENTWRQRLWCDKIMCLLLVPNSWHRAPKAHGNFLTGISLLFLTNLFRPCKFIYTNDLADFKSGAGTPERPRIGLELALSPQPPTSGDRRGIGDRVQSQGHWWSQFCPDNETCMKILDTQVEHADVLEGWHAQSAWTALELGYSSRQPVWQPLRRCSLCNKAIIMCMCFQWVL